MAVRAFVTRNIGGSVDSENGQIVLQFEVFYVGPEILEWSSGASSAHQTICGLNIVGTESGAQLFNSLVTCVVENLESETGLTMARTNMFIPSYVKGA